MIPREKPDYSDKPTIVVDYLGNDGVGTAWVEGVPGFPRNVRVVVRDHTIGSIPDTEGLFYQDEVQEDPDPGEPESIHDLFARVREHPDYVFGVIFVRDDFPNGEVSWDEWHDPKHAEEHITAAGFEYIEFGVPGSRDDSGHWEPAPDTDGEHWVEGE